MKRFYLLFLTVIISTVGFSQSYLGYVTSSANLRSEPNSNSKIIKTLERGSALFIVSKQKENGYYKVVNIDTDEEGFVYGNNVQVDKEIPKNEAGIFSPTGKSKSYKPSIEIFNNTELTLTLKLNEQSYRFAPKEKKTIKLSPGNYTYRASAPGVMPNYGTENMRSNYNYEWQFYISTSYR